MSVSLLPYTPERDVYRLLQVAPSADEQEIAVACRRLALAFHPDHNRSPRAHEEMQVVNAVRNLLTDPHSRAVYDGARRRFLFLGERAYAPRRIGSRGPGSRHTTARAIAAEVRPFERPRPVIEVLHERARRMGRALLAAVRNALAELGPSHCPTCKQPTQPTDRYCAWCGTWVGRTEKLPGA